MRKKAVLISAVVVMGLLTGCATPVNVSPASQSMVNQATNFTTQPGLAKVYFVGGRMGSSMSLKADMPGGAIFLIDGNKVGQIDRNDVLVVDVLPKQYTFGWQYPAGDSQIQFVTRQVNAGDVVILEANWNLGGTGFGLIGMMVSPAKYEMNETSNRGLIGSRRVVTHSSCPSMICR